jgi:hypothetical protein
MRLFISSLCIATAVAVSSAQQSEESRKGKNTAITLTGCIEQGGMPNQFTLSDAHNGRFQISGNRIARYRGQRVEIVGTTTAGKIQVRGGLWPSPNVAGQAGAMDPARAAVAAQPGGPSTGTRDVELPRFSVKSVRALDGKCG